MTNAAYEMVKVAYELVFDFSAPRIRQITDESAAFYFLPK